MKKTHRLPAARFACFQKPENRDFIDFRYFSLEEKGLFKNLAPIRELFTGINKKKPDLRQ